MALQELLARRLFEEVRFVRDAGCGVLAAIAIHDTRRGPAFGGIRRWAYDDLQAAVVDVLDLAQAMTWKCALAGIPGGGGKAVILDCPDLDRPKAYRLLGKHVAQMGGRFYTGPDVGTGDQDLAVVAGETRFVTIPGERGPGDLAWSTALGVRAGIRAVASRLDRELAGLRVSVQGLGAVGLRLCRMLKADGAELLVSDMVAARVERAADELGATPVAPTEIVGQPCDVFAPCALGGVIDRAALEILQASAVAGAANNVLATPDCGVELHRRGVLFAPDFAISAGALIHGALFHLEGKAPPPGRIEGIEATVGEVLDMARDKDRPPEQMALALAQERVAASAGEPYFPPR